MTTYVQARDAIVAYINTNFTAIPVYWENTVEVDLDAAGERFMRVEICFDDSDQASIGDNPMDRTYGAVVMTIFTRVGGGTRGTLAHIDTLKGLLRFRNLSGVHLQALVPSDARTKDGWEGREVLVPFWFDSIS